MPAGRRRSSTSASSRFAAAVGRSVRHVVTYIASKFGFKDVIGEVDNVRKTRMTDRAGHFHQSLGKMAIKKKIKSEDWRALYAGDLYHSLVDAPTSRTVAVLMLIYMFLVMLFSVVYWVVSKALPGSNLNINTYLEALAFSLQTMATIGYGAPDIFFGGYWLPVLVIAAQISCILVVEAVTIGVIYTRFGRHGKRASTIVMSDKAVIRRIGGKLYFMFQLVELRKHELIEAQVRLYTIRKDVAPPPDASDGAGTGPDATGTAAAAAAAAGGGNGDGRSNGTKTRGDGDGVTHFQTCKMRLSFPNDELGGLLIMCLPQIVVHEIDAWSPLMPPPRWAPCEGGAVHEWTPPALKFARLDEANLPGKGSYRERATRAVAFPAHAGRADVAAAGGSGGGGGGCGVGVPTRSARHRDGDDDDDDDARTATHEEEKEMVKRFMEDRKVEVLVLVEGLDATTGGPCQSRHSYVPSEIEWDKSFEKCVFEDTDGAAIIDFSVFHELVDVPVDAATCGHIPSHA